MGDWNNSFLLVGDEFRNFLAQIFYIYFISALFLKKYKIAVLYFSLILLSHWAYLLLLFMNWGVFLICQKFNLRKYQVVLIPFLAIFFAYIYKEGIIFYFSPAHYWYLNTSNIKKGLIEGFLHRPGVILATVIHLFTITLIFKNTNKINQTPIIKFFAVMFLILFGLSKYGVLLSDNFIESTRFYIIFAPYLAILLAYTLFEMPMYYIATSIFGFLFINFTLRNFAKETIPFWEVISKDDFSILKKSIIEYHNERIIYFICLLLLIFLLMMIRKYRKRGELIIQHS